MNNILLKKMIYKSKYRGCKETDMLLGKFATKRLKFFSQKELDIYQEFIEEDDLLIYNWIVKNELYPKIYSKIIEKIRVFANFNPR